MRERTQFLQKKAMKTPGKTHLEYEALIHEHL